MVREREIVLIPGGLGYAGGRIAHYLSGLGRYLVRVGTHRSGVTPPSWLEKGELVHLNLLSRRSLQQACRGISHVVHCAALNEQESLADPEKALLVNTLGVLKTLQEAEAAGGRRFLFVSTAHIYGAPPAGTITEETLPRPAHPYSITHRASEDLVLVARKKTDLTGVVLRLPNSIGAPMDPGVNCWMLIVHDLCRQAVTQKRLVLRSAGLQWRLFIPMEEVPRAVEHLLTTHLAPGAGNIFNLAGRKPMRIIDMAKLIAERATDILDFTPEIIRPDPFPGEHYPPFSYRMEKLEMTGFTPSGSLEREIDRLLRFCQDHFTSAGK